MLPARHDDDDDIYIEFSILPYLHEFSVILHDVFFDLALLNQDETAQLTCHPVFIFHFFRFLFTSGIELRVFLLP